MASSNCWKCLSRRVATIQFSPALVPRLVGPTFSTSSILSYPPPTAKKRGASQVTKGTKTLKIKKKAVVKTGKPPSQGERKAMRKRIVLSNTNALEVPGLSDLDEKLVDDIAALEPRSLQENPLDVPNTLDETLVGKVVGLQSATVDSLRASEAFKTTQGWGLFRRPGLLIREESVILSKRLVDAQAEKRALRLVVDGDRKSGKSLMLLHAMATAFVKGWVVVNIPEAQELSNAVTDYAAIPRTTPTIWSQNTYTANWLGQIAKANDAALSKFKVKKDHKVPIIIPADTTLTRLCELGARDPDVAWPVFQAFWSEITSEGRPPILMCLDSLSFIMQNSEYRAPDFSLIHTHDLAIVQHFINYFSGSYSFPNGGAIIAATNRSHAPISKSMDLAIQQALERQAGMEVSERDPYERKYDDRAYQAMKGAEVMRLKGVSKAEARGLMEYWAQSGVFRARVDEEAVAERWALAGNGIIGEIQRNALWMRI